MTSKAKADNQNIQVFVRVRPSNAAERKSRSVVELKSEKEITVKDPKNSNTFKTFTFNNVFGPNSSQVDVYCSVVRPLIDEVLSGYNCTVFAYGQTGTGKTFTMEGECSTDVNVTWEKDPLAGIVPRTLSQLFDELRLLQVDFSVKVSFLELYNEELFDLLSSSDDMPKLRIFEDSTKKGAVILSGLEEVSVHSKNDVYNIMKRGSHRRQTASTLMNARSSRSHTVFTVTVHIKESANEGEEVMRTGKMNLVDLAGSENIGRSGAVDKRAREAGNINQSLLTLGRVITALVDRSPHIPYRESKLTRILQESLGGRTKTSIIATVSPAACNLEETLSTLDYAHRAKNIQNKPEINQRLCKKTMLKEYSEEIERLQRDLEATRQRTGVYLDQAEYDNMMVLLDQLAVEVKEKEEELISLQQEMEKKQAICDELFTKTQAVKEAVKERTAFNDEQVSKLVKLRAETSQISTDISEKDYLMLRHMETLESLSSQTNTLHKTTVDSTQSVGLLYDKMDRVRTALQRNESAIENFVQKNNSIVGESKAIIEENSVSFANSASELKTVFKKNLTSMGTHYSDIDSALKGFEMVQDHASSLCQAITEVHGQEPSLKVKTDEIQANHQSAYSKYRGRLNDLRGLMETTKQYLSTDSDTLMDLSLQMNMECGAANEILQEWTCGQPLSDLSSNLTTKVENAVKTINTVVKEDDVFVQEYANLQKMSQEKFGAVLKLVAEIESIGENMNTLVNARNASVDESANAVLNMVEEAKETVKSAIDNEKGKVESTLNQVHHQLDRVSHISSKLRHLKCFKGDVNSELLPLDVVSQEGRKIVMASDLLKNSVKEKLDSVANNYEQLTEFHDSCAKEIVSLICTAQRDVKEHTNNLHSSLELFKADVHKEKEVMNDIVRSVEEPLSKQVQDYENSLDLVQSLGAKPSTPTGKTPLRSDVQIPRDLPATSPHQRILSRLRSKYNIVSKMNAEDSPSTDSAYSDVESDFNISEMDLSANKENSFIERESSSSEKSFQSYLPKPRKPLANNN